MIGILTEGGEKGFAVPQLVEAAERRNIKIVLIPMRKLILGVSANFPATFENINLLDLDALIFRGFNLGSLEQVILRMDALHRLERLGMKVYNPPSAIEKASDKFYASALLEEAGLPTPRCFVTEDAFEALKVFKEIGDVVVKPLFGSQGKGITRATDIETASRIFNNLAFSNLVIYMQEFVPHGNRDIRAFTIGEEVVAAMYRVSDSWKTNVYQGAKPVACKLEAELEELSIKAAKVLGCEYAGVDILESPNGPTIIEVNSSATWKGLYQATKIPIADLLLDYILKKAKQ
ncbi:MAG: RimK family alpha-L-glutamate ligase [Candidatus Jordarchaeum sp.]|uniref:RimK family alpha-L-glutamate ligase n=1 Tax=Candidatus Jordarchaeum sp. TaxID=2823881 RepID=UPI00404A2B9C